MKILALLILLLAGPAAALAQPVSTTGDPFPARTGGVLTVDAYLSRDAIPVAAIPSGYTVTWSAWTSDGKNALLWCDRPSIEDCSGRFNSGGIIQAKSGFPVRHGMPNPSLSLAGKTVTLRVSIAKQTSTGEKTLAVEARDLVFAAAGAPPTSPPAPTPTPAEPTWGIRTTIRQ